MEHVKRIHSLIIKSVFQSNGVVGSAHQKSVFQFNGVVGSALVDMYAKGRNINDSQKMFDEMPE